jgi:hypothetical protein
MNNMEKIIVPLFENINAFIFHFSERPFLANFPDRGVETPLREGELTHLLCVFCTKCIRRTYFGLVMSVRPSVRMIQLENHWVD